MPLFNPPSSFNAASPPPIGNTTPNTGAFTSLTTTGIINADNTHVYIGTNTSTGLYGIMWDGTNGANGEIVLNGANGSLLVSGGASSPGVFEMQGASSIAVPGGGNSTIGSVSGVMSVANFGEAPSAILRCIGQGQYTAGGTVTPGGNQVVEFAISNVQLGQAVLIMFPPGAVPGYTGTGGPDVTGAVNSPGSVQITFVNNDLVNSYTIPTLSVFVFG